MSHHVSVSHQQWLKQTRGEFSLLSETAALDARVLLCHCLQKPLSYVLAWPERTIPAEISAQLNKFKQRRLEGEPLAYIIGEREFWSMNFEVTSAVLIPRAETELLVEWTLDCIARSDDSAGDDGTAKVSSILELGTGSGAIAVALAKEHPQLKIVATDISERALQVARRNASINGCKNIHFCNGNWFDAIKTEKFEFVVSNPPYVAEGDPHLQEGDLPYEPKRALVAEEKGLSDIQLLVANAKKYLHSKGWLGLEHGFEQAESVRQMMLEQGYENIQTIQDLTGMDRLSVCQWVEIP